MSRYSLKNLIKETYIGRESFETLVDSFAEQGYTYYPYDRNTDPTKISIFLSLEQEAGDNLKAFTFVPQRKGSGDVTGIGIFAMPGERYYYFDDATEDDVELLAGAGQLNENRGAWDDGIQWGLDNDVEDAADTLAEMGAKFIEFDYDIDDVNQYSADTAFESISLMMEKEYSGDDTLYYAYEDYYDGNERKKAFVFSDGEYVDATFWSDYEIELFKGAGQLTENQTLTEDEYPDPESAEDIADFLSKNGATFHELTDDEIDIIGDAWAYGGSRSGQEAGLQTTKDILNKHKEPGRPIFTYDEGSGGMFYIVFNDGTGGAYYLEGFEDMSESDAYDYIINAGNLYEDLDLEDPKMGDTFDSYAYNLLGLIDPYGYNKGNYQELSTGYSYKYGTSHSSADLYEDNAINTLPKPVAEELTNIIESSYAVSYTHLTLPTKA